MRCRSAGAPGSSDASGARIAVDDPVQRVDGGRPRERARAGDRFVEHAAERENVGAVIGGAAFGLFRRHVADGAHHQARGRPGDAHRLEPGLIDRQGGLAAQLGETEIEDLGVAAGGDHHVVGLEVAMDDAGGMRGGQRVGGLRQVLQDLLEIARLARQERAEGLTLHELHRDVVDRPRRDRLRRGFGARAGGVACPIS